MTTLYHSLETVVSLSARVTFLISKVLVSIFRCGKSRGSLNCHGNLNYRHFLCFPVNDETSEDNRRAMIYESKSDNFEDEGCTILYKH